MKIKKSEVVFVSILIFSLVVVLISKVGSERFLVVLGGSMSPTINMGDLVIVNPTDFEEVEVNDVIAFRDRDRNIPVTHRVVNITEGGLITKGDANEDPDHWVVKPDDIIGKVSFTIPLVGYFVHYARSKYGFIFLVLIPGMIVIYGEVRNILTYWKGSKTKKKRRRKKSRKNLLGSILILVFSSALLLQSTVVGGAFFLDSEISSNNTFKATEWEETNPIEIVKWWSDTDFNEISNFSLVIQNKSSEIISTNPGGFYINIKIKNLPEAMALNLVDEISGEIKDTGDFVRWPPNTGNPLHVYLNGSEVTSKFEWTFDNKTLSLELKENEILSSGELYITLHLKYALIGSSLNDSELELFPRIYENVARVTVNGETVESQLVNLTALLKIVGSCNNKNSSMEEQRDTGYENSTNSISADTGSESYEISDVLEEESRELTNSAITNETLVNETLVNETQQFVGNDINSTSKTETPCSEIRSRFLSESLNLYRD